MEAAAERTADQIDAPKRLRTNREHTASMVSVKRAIGRAMAQAPHAIGSEHNSHVDHPPIDLPSFVSHPDYPNELDDSALQHALSVVLSCSALSEMDASVTSALIDLFSAFQPQLAGVSDKPLVLVMGDHLSGKSTALNYLAGHPFVMSGEGEHQTLTMTQDTPSTNTAAINHTKDSSWLTCLPRITHSAAGDAHFLEVPDSIQQPSAALALLNTLIVQRAMMMAQSVKTVLLFDMAQLYTETMPEHSYFKRLEQHLSHLTEQGVGVDSVLMGFTKVPLKMQMMPINLAIIKEFLFSRFTQLPAAFPEQILICDPLERRAQQGCGLSDWLARIDALSDSPVELIQSNMVRVSPEEQTVLLKTFDQLAPTTRAKALSTMLPLFPQCADQLNALASECKSAMGAAMQSISALIQQQDWPVLTDQVINLARLEGQYAQLDPTHAPIVDTLLDRIDRIQFQSTLLTTDEATLSEWLQDTKPDSVQASTRSPMSSAQLRELIDSGYSQQEVDLMASQGIPAFLMRKLVDSTIELSFEQSVDSITSCIDLGLNEAQKVADKDVILVVGNSGCGKSTAVNYLVGCEMEIQREGFTSQVRVKDNSAVSEVTPIGHDERSKTFIPMIAQRNNNSLFVDAPGFFDNRGTEINIANAVNTKNLLAVAKSVRLAMLFPFNSLDLRGRGVSEMIKTLSDLFGEQCALESIADHVVIGVTRVPLTIEGVDITHADIVDKVMSYQLLPDCFRDNIMILDPLERRVDEQNGLTHWQDRFDQLKGVTDTQALFKTVLSSEDELMLLKASQHIARDVAQQLAIPKPATVAAHLNQLRALQAVDHPQVRQLYRDNVEQLDQLITQQAQALQQRMSQRDQAEQHAVGESLVEFLNSVRLLAVFNTQYEEYAQNCLTQFQHAHCNYLLAQFEQQARQWQALVLRINQIPLDTVALSYNHFHDLIKNKPESFSDALMATVLNSPLIAAQSESLQQSIDAIKHYAHAASNQSLLGSMQSRFMSALQETLVTVERVFTQHMHQQLTELQNVCGRQWSAVVAELQWDKQDGEALLAALNTVKNMDTFDALQTLLAAFKTIDALNANVTMMVDTMHKAHTINSTLLQPQDLNAWANFSYDSLSQARNRVTDQAQQAEQLALEQAQFEQKMQEQFRVSQEKLAIQQAAQPNSSNSGYFLAPVNSNVAVTPSTPPLSDFYDDLDHPERATHSAVVQKVPPPAVDKPLQKNTSTGRQPISVDQKKERITTAFSEAVQVLELDILRTIQNLQGDKLNRAYHLQLKDALFNSFNGLFSQLRKQLLGKPAFEFVSWVKKSISQRPHSFTGADQHFAYDNIKPYSESLYSTPESCAMQGEDCEVYRANMRVLDMLQDLFQAKILLTRLNEDSSPQCNVDASLLMRLEAMIQVVTYLTYVKTIDPSALLSLIFEQLEQSVAYIEHKHTRGDHDDAKKLRFFAKKKSETLNVSTDVVSIFKDILDCDGPPPITSIVRLEIFCDTVVDELHKHKNKKLTKNIIALATSEGMILKRMGDLSYQMIKDRTGCGDLNMGYIQYATFFNVKPDQMRYIRFNSFDEIRSLYNHVLVTTTTSIKTQAVNQGLFRFYTLAIMMERLGAEPFNELFSRFRNSVMTVWRQNLEGKLHVAQCQLLGPEQLGSEGQAYRDSGLIPKI